MGPVPVVGGGCVTIAGAVVGPFGDCSLKSVESLIEKTYVAPLL